MTQAFDNAVGSYITVDKIHERIIPLSSKNHRRDVNRTTTYYAVMTFDEKRYICQIRSENEQTVLTPRHQLSDETKPDGCPHHEPAATVRVAVDEIARKIYVLQTMPLYHIFKPERVKQRNLTITVFDMVFKGEGDGLIEDFTNMYFPANTYFIQRSTDLDVSYSLATSFLIDRNGALYIVFHRCTETAERQFVVSIDLRRQDKWFTLKTIAEVPFFDAIGALVNFVTVWQRPIGAADGEDVFTTEKGTLCWLSHIGADSFVAFHTDPRLASSSTLLLSCVRPGVTPYDAAAFRYYVIRVGTQIARVVGFVGHFLIMEVDDVVGNVSRLKAISFRTRMLFDLTSWLRSSTPIYKLDVFSVEGQSFFLNGPWLLMKQRGLMSRRNMRACVVFRHNLQECLLQLDGHGLYRCETCDKVTKRKPRCCRVCKRLDARRALRQRPDWLQGGYTVRFCSNRCLKSNWRQHRELHDQLKSGVTFGSEHAAEYNSLCQLLVEFDTV